MSYEIGFSNFLKLIGRFSGRHKSIRMKQRRNRAQILSDKLKALEAKREKRIDKYILPIEIEIEEQKEKIKKYYQSKGIIQ